MTSKTKESLSYLKILICISFIFFLNGLKSQTAFSTILEKSLQNPHINKIQIDSLNKCIDTFLFTKGTTENLLILMFRIEQLATDINYPQGEADAKFNIARNYTLKYKSSRAIKYFFKSLSISEGIGDTARMAKASLQIGVVYYMQKNYGYALTYFRQASELYKHTIQLKKQSQCDYLLGIVYRDLKKYDSAEIYFLKGINLKFQMKNKNVFKDSTGIKESYMEIANMFIVQQLPDSALVYVNKSSLFASDLLNDHAFLTRKYNIEGQAYLLKNNTVLAFQSSKLCLREATLNMEPPPLADAYKLSARVAFEMNNYKDAYEFQNKFLQLKDSLFSSVNSALLVHEESNYDISKKETEISLLEEKKRLYSFLIYAFIGGLILLIIIIRLLYNRNLIKQKANTEITQQKNIVDKKNLEITQSINYAKRIQTAILPSNRMIKEYLTDSFIYYQPKDIVAGDFYWMETIASKSQLLSSIDNLKSEIIKPEIILFAACDCTGHGVPGALVSVVCHNALNRAVREFGLSQPAAILDKTAELIIENFAKSEEEIKDGMDISLCYYNTTTRSLQWAGANNPLWIVRKIDNPELPTHKAIEKNTVTKNSILDNSNYQLIEVAPDKQPIGEEQRNHPFTNHSITLFPEDTIYLFTDGYADQFSGDKVQKKLTRKRFKELLLSIQQLSMENQGIELEKFITNYRKKEEQIDDILIMGVRV